MKPSHIEALEHLVSWMQAEVLPSWIGRARRGPYGWFSRRMSAQGEPLSGEPVYLVTQAQIINVISRAEQLGWVNGMHTAIRNLIDTCGRYGTLPCRSDGYIRSISDGDPPHIIDEHYDLEDHAFFVMANAASFNAYGEDADIRRAYNIVDWLDVQFSCENGGWKPGNYSVDIRLSRSHRQMLLAFVSLFHATHKPVWRERAGDVFRLFSEKFFSSLTGTIYQQFDERWNVLDADGEVDLKEQLAWVSALSQYRGIDGQPMLAEKIYKNAVACVDAEDRRRGNCVTSVLCIAAGLDLIAAGLKEGDYEEIENEVAQRIGKFFRNYVPGDAAGIFIDDESSTPSGSADVLFLLFEAAVQASQILYAYRQANS